MHTRTAAHYPTSGLGGHNFCRNPDGETGPWCYPATVDTRWELCGVGEPAAACPLPPPLPPPLPAPSPSPPPLRLRKGEAPACRPSRHARESGAEEAGRLSAGVLLGVV